MRLEIKTLDGSIYVRTSDVWAESQIKHEPQRYSTIEKADYEKWASLQALQTDLTPKMETKSQNAHY